MQRLNAKDEKYYYLQQMGIDIWRLRQTNQQAEIVCEGFSLRASDQRIVAEVWLASIENSNNMQQKAYHLLDAMLSAIGLRREPRNEKASSKFCLVMGEALVQLFTGSTLPLSKLRLQTLNNNEQTQIISATYHPLELLEKPAKKREAWQDLQNFCKTIDIPLVKRKDAHARI